MRADGLRLLDVPVNWTCPVAPLWKGPGLSRAFVAPGRGPNRVTVEARAA